MNQNPYTRLKKVLISLVIAIGLCVWLINGVGAQNVHLKSMVKNVDTIKYDILTAWLVMSPNSSSIKMSLPDSTITVRGDTLAVIKEMFNQFSDMSNRLRIEIELNDKYRKAWADYMDALKNYKKRLRIVKNHKI